MRILPVLDVQGGFVVRGVGGRRHEYRPVVSRLETSSAPPTWPAFRRHFGLNELYLADLDALAGADPAFALYEALHRDGFRLWVDAGVRDVVRAEALAAAGVAGIVVGLETIRGPAEVARCCSQWGERVVFSLDLKGGVPLGDTSAWESCDAWAIAAQAIAVGVRQLLVLDLARVGEGSGTGTEELCAALATSYPTLAIAAGGGIRGSADLRRLQASGVTTALVASALHDGKLPRHDLDELTAGRP